MDFIKFKIMLTFFSLVRTKGIYHATFVAINQACSGFLWKVVMNLNPGWIEISQDLREKESMAMVGRDLYYMIAKLIFNTP